MFEFLCRKVKISHVGTVQKVKKVKKSARLLLYSINTLASQCVAQMRSFVPSCWDPPKQSKRHRNVVKTSATLVVAMTAASQRGGCPARQLRRCDEFAPSPNAVHVLARLQYGLGITSIWLILQKVTCSYAVFASQREKAQGGLIAHTPFQHVSIQAQSPPEPHRPQRVSPILWCFKKTELGTTWSRLSR